MEKVLVQNTRQMLNQMDMMLTFSLKNVENTMHAIENSADIRTAMRTPADRSSQNNLRHMFSLFESQNPEIAGILFVFASDGSYISRTMQAKSRDSLTKESWYREAMGSPGKYLLLSKPIGRNLSSNLQYGDDEIMSIVKAIANPYTGNYEGVLLVDFRLSSFDENIKNIILGSKGFLYVTNTKGDIIYAPSNNVVYRIDNYTVLENSDEKSIAKIHEEYYQIIYRKSDNWNVMGVFLMGDIMSAVNIVRGLSIVLFLCIVIFMQIFFNRLDRKLFIPLNDLQKLMNVAETKTIDVKYDVQSNDEIGSLGHSFNHMISEIGKLLAMVEEEHNRKREAEFRVLQEQIKPHFLYNTLEAINWMALEHGATDIVSLVTALTKLFHISLSNGKEMISLQKEIELVENYLIIQGIRYEDAFQYEFDVDENLLDCQILKLILQPLVENSLYHGIKEKDSSGYIKISIRQENEDLLLTVSDDGVGLSEVDVCTINEMFLSEKRTVGYGLFNTNQRIKHTFGPDYGLRIESHLQGWTRIFVKHPLIRGNEDEIANRGRRT
ncbi:MAG: sensor histidine kinase [Oscillospiraceae bacterium]|jgi:two-component system sensor histidine kinase YesM|nr:sensor histidine kinase [Oscillospiraceae bacterium]